MDCDVFVVGKVIVKVFEELFITIGEVTHYRYAIIKWNSLDWLRI